MSTFVFSEREKDIAGKDGVVVFNEIYASRAKFVVVLYRDGYGETKWTRVEQTAITDRSVNIGWQTILLISVDGKKPVWIPGSRLHYGLEAFGNQTAAEAIVGRFRELGVPGQPLTLTERAAQVGRRRTGNIDADM